MGWTEVGVRCGWQQRQSHQEKQVYMMEVEGLDDSIAIFIIIGDATARATAYS
jgi:hypothetical protein